MGRLLARLAFVGLFIGLGASAAQADDDIAKKLLDNPNVGSWVIYGPQSNTTVKDAAVQGGAAIEVKVPGPAANPWDAAGQVVTTGKINKGTQIVNAVWLRAPDADATPAQLHVRLQEAAAPYAALGETDFNLTSAWKLYSFTLIADQDYPKGGVMLSVFLANAKQTIDLGPAFIVDAGVPAP